MNHKAELLDWDSIGNAIANLREQKRWHELALISCAAFTGCRPSDWTKFKWELFIREDGTVRREAWLFEVKAVKMALARGKKPRARKLFLIEQFQEIILECWKGMNKPYLNVYIFRTHKGPRSENGGISTQTANAQLKKLAVEFGMNPDLTTYSFRRTGARRIHDAMMGSDPLTAVRATQRFMNHASMTSTMHYIGLTDEEVSVAFSKLKLKL